MYGLLAASRTMATIAVGWSVSGVQHTRWCVSGVIMYAERFVRGLCLGAQLWDTSGGVRWCDTSRE